MSKKSYLKSFFGGLIPNDRRIFLDIGGVLGKPLGEVRETISNMAESSRLSAMQARDEALNQIPEQENNQVATSLNDLESQIPEQYQEGKSEENHNEVSKLELDLTLDSKSESCSSSCMIDRRDRN